MTLLVNVEAARQLGMKAVQFLETSQALSDMRALLACGS